MIDNSSAFRMDTDVPLIIPEINPEDIRRHRGMIANPNCTTAVALMALHPLHSAFGLRRVFASSYQAVSGSGSRAIEELKQQVEASVGGGQPVARVYPHPIAFNVLPTSIPFRYWLHAREEMKMQNEGRKIMHLPDFRASVTCVRVPVYRAHSVAMSAEFERPVSLETAPGGFGESVRTRPESTSRFPTATPLRSQLRARQLSGRPVAPRLRIGKRSRALGFGRSIAERRGPERRADHGAAVTQFQAWL